MSKARGRDRKHPTQYFRSSNTVKHVQSHILFTSCHAQCIDM